MRNSQGHFLSRKRKKISSNEETFVYAQIRARVFIVKIFYKEI